jgi:iron complex transport system substrate-binding protein
MKKSLVSFLLFIMMADGLLFISMASTVNAESYHRIVSLAPSITEILFALGLGDRVVGVTRYCTYPPAALTKAKVGGYYDPNYEAILRLRPDLVIVLAEHDAAKRYLRNFHSNVMQVNHRSIGDIVGSIKAIGDSCGAARAADSILASIKASMERIRAGTAHLRSPRVMVSVGRSMGTTGDLCIAGVGTYYDEMIRLAGGQNAFTEKGISFPTLSPEGVLRVNPEVIIDLVPESNGVAPGDSAVRAAWAKFGRVDAVRKGRVFIFRQDFAEIPGPRFILLLEEMAKVIHPDIAFR